MIFMLLSLFVISFLISVKPLNEPYLNKMEIFNESTLLMSSYFMFLFTDFVDDANMRSKLGWVYIGVIGLLIVVNFGCMIIKVYQMVSEKIRNLWGKYQQYKIYKAIKEQ